MLGERTARNCLLVLALGVSTVSTTSATIDAPAVTTASGPVQGFTGDDVDKFLGIPYASPPVGDLRWMPPVPPAPWTLPRPTLKFARKCAQRAYIGAFSGSSDEEDCLYLNVFASKKPNPPGHAKPVLLWIFGGGLFAGEADDYDGTLLAARGNAVVVTINYRLGVLGWLAHPALDKEGHPFANYGMLDQQFALKWVHDNIAAFGGDPNDVTIFGESAGATSVISHIVSPLSNGLFQQAIAQSGSATILKYPYFLAGGRVGAAKPLAVAEESGAKLATALGCTDQTAACLRKIPAKQIIDAQAPYMVNEAIIDGVIIPTAYGEALRSGPVNRVSFLNGNTLDEWRWSFGLAENRSGKPIDAAGYPELVKRFFGEDMAARILSAYPLADYPSPSLAMAAAATDGVWACSARRVDTWLSARMPVYAYEFADQTAPSYLMPTSFPLGAGHTMDIQYVFPRYHGDSGVVRELNPLQQKLSATMIDYWTHMSSAQAGSLWAPYDPKLENVMNLALPAPEMRTGNFAKTHKCDFWDGMGIY